MESDWLKNLTTEQNEEINKIVAKHRRKWDEELAEKLSELSNLQKQAEQSEQSKSEMAAKLEKMRQESLTDAQKKVEEMNKLKMALSESEKVKSSLQSSLQQLTIQNAIKDVASKYKPKNLAHLTKLVTESAKIDDNNNVLINEKPVEEALKDMCESPETSYMFDQPKVSGTGQKPISGPTGNKSTLETELEAMMLKSDSQKIV